MAQRNKQRPTARGEQMPERILAWSWLCCNQQDRAARGPAVLKAWPTGKVEGLRARGGYEVDMEWKDGALTQAVVRGISNKPGKVAVRYGKGPSKLTLDRGQSRVIRPDDFGAEK
jgi:hypothetical protein